MPAEFISNCTSPRLLNGRNAAHASVCIRDSRVERDRLVFDWKKLGIVRVCQAACHRAGDPLPHAFTRQTSPTFLSLPLRQRSKYIYI